MLITGENKNEETHNQAKNDNPHYLLARQKEHTKINMAK